MSVLVGKQAPDFTAAAVLADGSIKADFSLSDYAGKYVVLFFYPLDFTFVCPTELIAFSKRIKEFEEDNFFSGHHVKNQFEFESQKENIINVFKLSKLLSEAKSIFITNCYKNWANYTDNKYYVVVIP